MYYDINRFEFLKKSKIVELNDKSLKYYNLFFFLFIDDFFISKLNKIKKLHNLLEDLFSELCCLFILII